MNKKKLIKYVLKYFIKNFLIITGGALGVIGIIAGIGLLLSWVFKGFGTIGFVISAIVCCCFIIAILNTMDYIYNIKKYMNKEKQNEL